MGQHGATAGRALGDRELVRAVLEDWRTAPVSDGLRATLGFIERLTLAPGELGKSDVDAVRAAGVTDEALEDAIHVCVCFVVINKLADALGFEMLTPETYERRAAMALEHGYVIPPQVE